jgi:hypothetical protein
MHEFRHRSLYVEMKDGFRPSGTLFRQPAPAGQDGVFWPIGQ